MRMFTSAAVAAATAVASPAFAIDSFDPTPNPAAISPVAVAALSAVQPVRLASGVRNGLSWTAASRIIGQTPTSDVGPPPNNTIGGGNPIYKPTAQKSGTVALIMETPDGAFICSGSVLSDGRSIATAAHCITDNTGKLNVTKTTVHFFNGDPDQRTVGVGNTSVTADVKGYFIHPNYTGEVIDQNDIAILRIGVEAPASAQRYDLYTPGANGLTGTQFNVAGYGTRSTVGGAAGNTPPAGARTGFLREGDNIYDYAWGDSRFQGFFTDRETTGQFAGQNFFGFAEVEFSYISDFDNGLRAQDTARRVANGLGLGPIGNLNFDNTGVGAREVGVAGGDSGGPGFVNGKLASINSYGLTFGANFGDSLPGLNSSWGEFSGYVPVYIHTDFIASTAVPEPASWAMLIMGFGLAGTAMRRRRAIAA
jgi:hypothetical protein